MLHYNRLVVILIKPIVKISHATSTPSKNATELLIPRVIQAILSKYSVQARIAEKYSIDKKFARTNLCIILYYRAALKNASLPIFSFAHIRLLVLYIKAH